MSLTKGLRGVTGVLVLLLSMAHLSAAAEEGRGPLIMAFTSFRWGYTVSPAALPVILAANGQPGAEVVQLDPEWHRTADDLGSKEGFTLPRLGDFVLGKATAAELAAGLDGAYARHRDSYAKRLQPFEGRRADVLLLDVDAQFHYVRGGKNGPEASRERTVTALREVVAAARAGGVRVLLYVGGDGRTDGAYRPSAKRDEPRVPRTVADDEADLLSMDQAAAAARVLGIEVIPSYRAFAALRREQPSFPLVPMLSQCLHGTHPLNYLNAATIAAALLGRRPDLPDTTGREAVHRAVLEGYGRNAQSLKKLGIEEPPAPFTEEQLGQLHDAAWAAVQEVRAMSASSAGGDQ